MLRSRITFHFYAAMTVHADDEPFVALREHAGVGVAERQGASTRFDYYAVT